MLMLRRLRGRVVLLHLHRLMLLPSSVRLPFWVRGTDGNLESSVGRRQVVVVVLLAVAAALPRVGPLAFVLLGSRGVRRVTGIALERKNMIIKSPIHFSPEVITEETSSQRT